MSDKDDKPVFIISVAAELCDMHPQTLRMYERKGLVRPKRLKDRRLYSQSDIKRLMMIQELTQEAGINLAGVKRIIDLQADLESAVQAVAELEQRIEKMQQEMQIRINNLLKKQSNQIVKVTGGAMIRYEPDKNR